MARNRKISVSFVPEDISYLIKIQDQQQLSNLSEAVRFIVTESRGIKYKSPEYLQEKLRSQLEDEVQQLRADVDEAEAALITMWSKFGTHVGDQKYYPLREAAKTRNITLEEFQAIYGDTVSEMKYYQVIGVVDIYQRRRKELKDLLESRGETI